MGLNFEPVRTSTTPTDPHPNDYRASVVDND